MTAPQTNDVQAVCSACGTRAVIRRGRPGAIYKCPKCQGALEPVAAIEPLRGSAGARTPPKSFTMTCPLCHTAVGVSAAQIGQSIDCPNCLTAIEVKVPVGAFQSRGDKEPREFGVAGAGGAADAPVDAPTGASLRSSPGHPSTQSRVGQTDTASGGTLVSIPPPPDDKYFAIVCPLCHTRMEATREQVGQSITCPDCRRPFEIKAPPPAVAKYRWTEDDGAEVRFEPTFERPQLEKLVLPAIEEQPKRRRAARFRRRPQLPLRAMVSGVAGLFRERSIWRRWLAYSAVLMVSLGLFDFSIFEIRQFAAAHEKVPVPAAVGLALVVFAAGILAALWFMSIARTLLAILDDAAEGLDRVENWPEGNILGGIWGALTIFYALVLSLVPGSALCTLIGGLVEDAWLVVPPLSVLLLFPLFLISMLERDSAIEPFSSEVWESLSDAPGPWILMYAISVVIWGFVGLVDWLTSEAIPIQEARIVLGPLVFTAGLFVYYRLLGRLTWMLAMRPDDAEEEEENHESDE